MKTISERDIYDVNSNIYPCPRCNITCGVEENPSILLEKGKVCFKCLQKEYYIKKWFEKYNDVEFNVESFFNRDR